MLMWQPISSVYDVTTWAEKWVANFWFLFATSVLYSLLWCIRSQQMSPPFQKRDSGIPLEDSMLFIRSSKRRLLPDWVYSPLERKEPDTRGRTRSRKPAASLSKLCTSPSIEIHLGPGALGISLQTSLSSFPSSWHSLSTGPSSIFNPTGSLLGSFWGISTNSHPKMFCECFCARHHSKFWGYSHEKDNVSVSKKLVG